MTRIYQVNFAHLKYGSNFSSEKVSVRGYVPQAIAKALKINKKAGYKEKNLRVESVELIASAMNKVEWHTPNWTSKDEVACDDAGKIVGYVKQLPDGTFNASTNSQDIGNYIDATNAEQAVEKALRAESD